MATPEARRHGRRGHVSQSDAGHGTSREQDVGVDVLASLIASHTSGRDEGGQTERLGTHARD